MVTHVCVSKAGTTCSKKTNLFLIQNSSIPLQEMNICGIFFFLLLSFGLSGMSVIVSSGELLYVLICNWKNDLKYKMITI